VIISLKRQLARLPTTRTIDDSSSSPAPTNTAVYYFVGQHDL
jgi:hypothetical protein